MAKWESAPLVAAAWESAPLDHGIDWAQPVETVRGAIAKLAPEDRNDAIRQWADAFVARERRDGGVAQGIDTAVRTAARGTLVGPFLDEITGLSAAALHKASGGYLGAPYDETVAYQRAKDRAIDREYPVASFAGKVAGGLAGGVGGAMAGGSANLLMNGPVALLRPAASGMGRIGQGVAGGATAGAIGGFGEGEGVGNRVDNAVVGGAVGGVLGGALGAGAETWRGIRSAVAGQGRTGAYDRFANQLPEANVETFANQVATGAARNDQTINRRTLDVLGQEMERAGGDRAQAVQSTIDRLVTQHGVTPGTAREQIRRLTAVHRDSELMLAEYPAVAESAATVRASRNAARIDLQEAGRVRDAGTHYLIDDLANSPGAQSSAAVRNAVADRNLGTRDAMRQTFDDLAPRAPGGTGPRTIADLDQMQEGATRAAAIEYQRAYAAPTNNRLLVGLLPRILDRHANRMVGRSGEQAQALERAINEFMIQRPDGQRLAMMTLQQLQDARGALRAQIDTARRGEQRHIVATLQPLYRDVTRLMERANPTWAAANRRWADNALDTVGRDLGEVLSLKAGPQFRAQMRQFQGLAPEAQDMVRVEFLQRLSDRLDNLGDTHDVAKLFTNEHMRSVIETLFGRPGVVALVQAVRDAGVATKSGRMLGGSQTAMRLARRADADAETGILGAAEIASVRGVRNALMQRLATMLAERRNQPLAEIVTTPLRDTAEVARHIHNMRTAQQYRQRVSLPSPYVAPSINALMNAAGQGLADGRR